MKTRLVQRSSQQQTLNLEEGWKLGWCQKKGKHPRGISKSAEGTALTRTAFLCNGCNSALPLAVQQSRGQPESK